MKGMKKKGRRREGEGEREKQRKENSSRKKNNSENKIWFSKFIWNHRKNLIRTLIYFKSKPRQDYKIKWK